MEKKSSFCPFYANLHPTAAGDILDHTGDYYPVGCIISAGKSQNVKLEEGPSSLLRDSSSSMAAWHASGCFLPKNERGWVALAASFRHPNDLWMSRLLATSHGRILGEGSLSNSSIPGLKFVVQAEDCTATASGTASVATSSRLVQRLAQGAFAKIGAQYQSSTFATEFCVDAVNGPTVLGSGVLKINNFKFGIKGAYNTAIEDISNQGELVALDGAIAYTSNDIETLFETRKKASIWKVTLRQAISERLQMAACCKHSFKKEELIGYLGGKLLVEPGVVTLQGKVASNGIASLAYTKRFSPLLKWTMCGHVDIKNFDSASHLVGINVQLG